MAKKYQNKIRTTAGFSPINNKPLDDRELLVADLNMTPDSHGNRLPISDSEVLNSLKNSGLLYEGQEVRILNHHYRFPLNHKDDYDNESNEVKYDKFRYPKYHYWEYYTADKRYEYDFLADPVQISRISQSKRYSLTFEPNDIELTENGEQVVYKNTNLGVGTYIFGYGNTIESSSIVNGMIWGNKNNVINSGTDNNINGNENTISYGSFNNVFGSSNIVNGQSGKQALNNTVIGSKNKLSYNAQYNLISGSLNIISNTSYSIILNNSINTDSSTIQNSKYVNIFGGDNNVISTDNSLVLGYGNTIQGVSNGRARYNIILGYDCRNELNCQYAYMFGQGLVPVNWGSVIIGRFNDTTIKSRFSIGTGANEENRFTAFYVDTNNNSYVNGDLYVSKSIKMGENKESLDTYVSTIASQTTGSVVYDNYSDIPDNTVNGAMFMVKSDDSSGNGGLYIKYNDTLAKVVSSFDDSIYLKTKNNASLITDKLAGLSLTGDTAEMVGMANWYNSTLSQNKSELSINPINIKINYKGSESNLAKLIQFGIENILISSGDGTDLSNTSKITSSHAYFPEITVKNKATIPNLSVSNSITTKNITIEENINTTNIEATTLSVDDIVMKTAVEESRDVSYRSVEIVHYNGSGRDINSHIIDLGYVPSCVIVFTNTTPDVPGYSDGGWHQHFQIATKDYASQFLTIIDTTDKKGFKVTGTATYGFDVSGRAYTALIFK